MSVYTVQAPTDALGDPEPERAVFLREGFSWPAFVFAGLWLLWHRLWAMVALWLLAYGVLAWLTVWHIFGLGTTLLIALALCLLLGSEGNSLLRRKLARRRYRLLDVVIAAAPEIAERLFFNRLSPLQAGHASALKNASPSPPLPNRDTEVLGVFPLPEERG